MLSKLRFQRATPCRLGRGARRGLSLMAALQLVATSAFAVSMAKPPTEEIAGTGHYSLVSATVREMPEDPDARSAETVSFNVEERVLREWPDSVVDLALDPPTWQSLVKGQKYLIAVTAHHSTKTHQGKGLVEIPPRVVRHAMVGEVLVRDNEFARALLSAELAQTMTEAAYARCLAERLEESEPHMQRLLAAEMLARPGERQLGRTEHAETLSRFVLNANHDPMARMLTLQIGTGPEQDSWAVQASKAILEQSPQEFDGKDMYLPALIVEAMNIQGRASQLTIDEGLLHSWAANKHGGVASSATRLLNRH